VQRAEAALVVGRDGDALEDPPDLVVGEAVLVQALARRAHDELLRARAGGHALGRDADHPARAVLGRHGRAEQRVDLLREDAGGRGGLVLGVARRDGHLGAGRALALAHELGDALRERLGLERRLAEDDLADDLVDDLLEARHVRALLVAAEVDEALQARREQLLVAALLDADDLLDLGHADPREADAEGGNAGLDVVLRNADALRHGLEGTDRSQRRC
jgi:hypothetical protein